MEKARAAAKPYTGAFAENWKYVLGENHWPTPTNQYHMSRDEWKAKTVRNRLFQTIDQKAAMVLDATPTVHAEPVSDEVTTEQLEMASMVVQSELKRLKWHEIREDIFLEGSVNGKAFAHLYTKPDKLAEMMGIDQVEICAEMFDGTRVWPDPTATRLSHARYLVLFPSWDYSRALEAFEKVAPDIKSKLKPGKGQPVANFGEASVTRDKSDDELVTGPGGDMILGKDGKISDCKVDVALVWVLDDRLAEEVQYQKDEYGTPKASTTKYSRMYPYGRLIIIQGDSLIYDGPSPYEIMSVFPVAEYTHYRAANRYWGYGEVALLKSAQMVADKNMAMALDGARLNLFGNLEVPIGADGYSNKGNAPNETIPVPPELSGMAHYVSPNNTNMSLLTWIDETNRRDFQEQAGVSDALAGMTPSSPTSGKELQTRAKLASTRIGRNLKHMNEFDSDFANTLFQLMRQAYVGERTFMVEGLNGEKEAIRTDVSMLPPGIAIRISADPDEIEKSELEGQNVQALVASGMLFDPKMIPLLPMLLPKYGIGNQLAKEIQRQIVGMVSVGLIPTDPMSYELITGQPMPPEMVAQYMRQQQMMMAQATGTAPGQDKPQEGAN